MKPKQDKLLLETAYYISTTMHELKFKIGHGINKISVILKPKTWLIIP